MNTGIRQLIFATSNIGKVKEVQYLIDLNNFTLLSLAELENFPFAEVIEDGNSFLENAQKKARHFFKILKKPLISDDSGLVVPALNGEPGIYSSRYAGPHATDEENNELLLKKLSPLLPKNRTAYFKTVLVYKDNKQEAVFEGKCLGRIINSPRGSNGFGYDPLFFVDEIQKTFAELKHYEKNKYSHRGKAIRTLKKFLLNKIS